MKTNPDLFPETLLIAREGSECCTTSLKVAEYFHKRHKNVLRAIDQTLADLTVPPLANPTFPPGCGLRFEPTSRRVLGPNGGFRNELMYLLSKDDFMLVTMSFTSVQALRWKLDFIAAFNHMAGELHARTARFATALDQVRPMLRPVVEATEAGYSRTDIAGPLGKSPASITYHRRAARRLGLLAA